MDNKVWHTVVQDDPEQPGEFIIELPEDLLKEVNWVEGDILEWKMSGEQIILSKNINSKSSMLSRKFSLFKPFIFLYSLGVTPKVALDISAVNI